MKFEQITADRIESAWDYVKRGLERIREKGKVRYFDEEVFVMLKRGRAGLFLGIEDGERRGFLITEVRTDDKLTGLPYAHVWILWAEPSDKEHFADVKKFLPEMAAFMDEHAKTMTGSKRWTLDGRRGWEKFLKNYCEPVYVRMERVIPEVVT